MPSPAGSMFTSWKKEYKMQTYIPDIPGSTYMMDVLRIVCLTILIMFRNTLMIRKLLVINGKVNVPIDLCH
ncbi:hypothetical protein CVS40_6811 [Lucilia cuprina]|nr:hypothetical protein CVS40_6811 [Lucilia cuprina]